MFEPILELRGVRKAYGRAGRGTERQVLSDVNLRLAAGRSLGLYGESGAGKSTLVRICLGLERPDSGEALFRGRALRGLDRKRRRLFRRTVQVVWQDPYLYLNPYLSVGRLLSEPMEVHALGDKWRRAQRVAELLEDVALGPEIAGRKVHQLSGGQCQRVALARALACEPSLLILDEALVGLDTISQVQMIRLLQDAKRLRGLAMLFISHDPRQQALLAETWVVLHGGRLSG